MKWSHRDKDGNNDDFTGMATVNESGNEVTSWPKCLWYLEKGFDASKHKKNVFELNEISYQKSVLFYYPKILLFQQFCLPIISNNSDCTVIIW